MNSLRKQLKQSPIIAAVKDEASTKIAAYSDCSIVFILNCNILNLSKIVSLLKQKNKIVFVHIDLIEGLGKDNWAIDYLHKKIKPHGIISTRSNLIKYAKSLDMLAVQRMFLLDSTSIQSGVEMAKKSNSDFVELMPGVIPKAISYIKRHITQPIIAGGMVTKISEIDIALQSGAVGISTSDKDLWKEEKYIAKK